MTKKLISLPHRADLGDIDCSNDPPLTKQEFAEESDINVIMSRFSRGVGMPSFNDQAPIFADCTQIGDFAECVRRVEAGREAFMHLDAKVRSRFDNDAAKLVAFLQDAGNREEAVKLGLVVEPEKPASPPADVVPPVK